LSNGLSVHNLKIQSTLRKTAQLAAFIHVCTKEVNGFIAQSQKDQAQGITSFSTMSAANIPCMLIETTPFVHGVMKGGQAI
jgi:hypothetical protein